MQHQLSVMPNLGEGVEQKEQRTFVARVGHIVSDERLIIKTAREQGAEGERVFFLFAQMREL
ncbi:hypothetical protein [Nostoc sp.]|uniref:hypothetical protein n=1 Tax=Nostoc sp. TaxID=1180 RepID=UPI002FF77886